METLKLLIVEEDRPAFESTFTGPLELGRQRSGEPEPYSLLPATGEALSRLIIARNQEANCARQHLRLHPLPDGTVRVENLSRIPLSCRDSSTTVPAGSSVEMAAPFSLILETRFISVVPRNSVDEHGIRGLDRQTLVTGSLSDLSRMLKPLPAFSAGQLDELIGWLQTTVGVLQSTVGSADFLDKAAEGLVQIVGLDSGSVLLLRDNDWKIIAVRGAAQEDADWRPAGSCSAASPTRCGRSGSTRTRRPRPTRPVFRG